MFRDSVALSPPPSWPLARAVQLGRPRLPPLCTTGRGDPTVGRVAAGF
jgi:hypothetical protein